MRTLRGEIGVKLKVIFFKVVSIFCLNSEHAHEQLQPVKHTNQPCGTSGEV